GAAEARCAQELAQLAVTALPGAERVGGHPLLETAIEPPVLDRLGDVLRADGRGAGEVRYGTGNAQHALIGPRREQQPRERVAQQLVAVAVCGAVAIDLARAEIGIRLGLARELRGARLLHPLPNRTGRLARDWRDQLRLARR